MTNDPVKRCNHCGWPIVPEGQAGCWEGNCSMRPMPSARKVQSKVIDYENLIKILVNALEVYAFKSGHDSIARDALAQVPNELRGFTEK